MVGETTRDPRVRHRCALFDDTIGLTCERLAIDSMPTIYLGSAQEWVAFSLWQVLLADAFNVGAGVSDAERLELGACRMKNNELWTWYRERAEEGRSDDWTPLERFDSSFLGTAKTAETKTILPFAMKMLEQHAVKVGQPTTGRRLASGSALLEFIHWLQVSPTRPSTAQMQAHQQS